jgi:serine/threonine protein phosphatase PrpC
MLAIMGGYWCIKRGEVASLAESAGARLRVECAELSLQGTRESNQDRVSVAVTPDAALLIACDGMGGHSDGEAAADIAQRSMQERFLQSQLPLLDPMGFLHLSMGSAHQGVVAYGAQVPLELRPRATCAVCIVQQSSAYWAHVGDSRIYHLRGGRVFDRTRDHSHVELLVREGVISAGQVQNHPMRNFVESCLGGEPMLPEMAISARHALLPGDVLLVCTDGFWGNLDESLIASAFVTLGLPLRETLEALAAQALLNAGAASDNTSVGALRFLDQE